jgi:threonine dehydratase
MLIAINAHLTSLECVCVCVGNHAQAIAYAAKATNRSATVVMPSNAPMTKREATQGYGANIRICEPENRAAEAENAAVSLGAELVHPSENPHVIAGQVSHIPHTCWVY